MASPIQYALNNIGKKAQQLFNPVGQAISRVPQQFGNYIQKTPQYQGAQMYQKAFQSPQVQNFVRQAPTQVIRLGQSVNSAVNAPYNAVNRQMAPVLQQTRNMPLMQRVDTVLPKAAKAFSSNLLPGYVPNVVNPLMDLGYNAAKSAAKPFIPSDVKKYYGIRETGFEDVGNIAGGLGAANIPGNIVGGAIGVGMNRLPVVGSNGKVSDAQAFDEGFKFSAKLGPLGKLAETPLKGLLNKINPKTVNTVNSLVSQKLYKEAAKLLVRRAGASAVSGGVGFGVYNTTLPAKNLQERVANALEGIATGAAFGAGTSIGGDVLGTGAKQLQRIYKNKPKLGMQSADAVMAPTDILISHEGAPDKARVEYYKKLIQSGKKVDPIVIINEGAKYGIEDGKHRFQAYKELGYNQVPVIFKGGEEYQQMMARAESSVKLPTQVEGLAKEASKYKSVEEFVKGQGKPLYHGTNEIFETFDANKARALGERGDNLWGAGFYTSPGSKTAKNYGENLMELYGKPKKTLDLSKFKTTKQLGEHLNISEDALMMRNGIPTAKGSQAQQLSSHAKELGYDSIFTPVGEGEMVILDPSLVKTKSQLTDIFNQSKGVQNADLSIKLPVAPQVVNGKIKMRSITAPKLEGTADLTKNQVIEGLNNQSQSPLQSASGNRIPELQPKTQLLNKIDQLKQSAQQSIQEQRAFAQAKAQQLAGLSANDLKDLASLRKMVGSKAGQVGDIETLYAKNPKLMDRVLNRMREVTGDYQGTAKTDVELLDHALSLPTKGSIKIQQPSELKQIKALKEDAAIARDLVYHAEPIKRSQSKADLFDKDLKEWSDMVYKDAVASEKAKTIDAVNKLTSSIEESTNKSLRSKYVTTKAGKVVTSKTGSGVEKALLEESTTWKDKPKVLYIRETMDRNFEDVMGKDAPRMKEVFLNPIKSSEAERIRFLNRERASIKDLGIKARSKESGLVQQFGEKKLSAEQVLEQVGGDAKKADQIINASNVLRKKYDTYLTDINKVLTRNGYDPIPKRDDYFTHFQEVSSALERFGIPIRDNKLPTDINGLTADFKPGKNFFSNALPRLGDKTDIDAITGIDRYLEGASQQMYHTDNIQRLRLLEKSIRAKYEGTTHLSNFVTELSEYTNGIAGKKAMIDRAAEAMVGRNIYGAVNRLRSQVGANMVGANVSSALTNYIPLTQSLATTNKKSFVKGMMSTIGNVFKNDGFVDRSDFLTKRFGSDKLSMNLWDKAADKAGWFFKAVDHFTASTVVRSKFDEGIKMGLSPSKAMLRADNWAEKIIGGRSVGDMPTLFQSRTLGLFTQFQLEVNNQMSFMAKDIPRNFDKKGAAASLGQLFLYSYLFNNLYEKAVGRRPAFDPVGVAQKSYEDYTNPDLPKNQANINLLSNVAQNLPFSSLLEGGRIPMGSAMPNPFAIMKGESDLKTELSKPLWYIAPPFGGGQAKKTVEGIGAYNQGYSESKKGLIRFPIDKSPISGVKSALFGQWSGENSQKYIREGQNVLGKDQSANYKQLPPSDRQTYMDSVNQGRVQNRQIEKQKEEYDKTGSASPTNVKVLNDDVIKANLKYSKGNIYTTKDALFIKRPDTSVNKIPLTNELTGNAIQQAKQLATKESAIQSAGVAIYNRTDIPDWEKNEAYKALGTTAQDVEFRALKSLKDGQQATVLFNLLKERKWKQEKVDAFIKSDVLTNNVVGKMEDQGLINEAQAKDLKAYIKSTSIKLGKVSGSSKKAKKIKMPKLKAIKVKYSKLKIKIPKPKKYKSLLSKGRSNKYFK